jgi:hypothetical protein
LLHTPFLPFLWFINYNHAFDVTSLPHIHRQFDFDWRFFPFLEFMASHMTTSYEPQVAQVNEKPPRESYLDLMLMQHLHDEDPKPWKVHPCFEIKLPWTWYYRISPNSRTLVILLQINPVCSHELKIICEGFYKTENISIFAWFSIRNVGHYYWLCDLICRLPPNNKEDYLIRIIQRILNFLQLWTIIVA